MKAKKSRFVICAYCKKEFEDKLNFKCRPRKYCGVRCTARAISHLGIEAIKKIDRTGCKNANWKGGISKDNYHYQKIARMRRPSHEIAMKQLKNAIISKKISKPNICSICGFTTDNKSLIHGHHEDYSKPLDVIWACRKCHIKLHKKTQNPPSAIFQKKEVL